jgi:hypothetical protein
MYDNYEQGFTVQRERERERESEDTEVFTSLFLSPSLFFSPLCCNLVVEARANDRRNSDTQVCSLLTKLTKNSGSLLYIPCISLGIADLSHQEYVMIIS